MKVSVIAQSYIIRFALLHLDRFFKYQNLGNRDLFQFVELDNYIVIYYAMNYSKNISPDEMTIQNILFQKICILKKENRSTVMKIKGRVSKKSS